MSNGISVIICCYNSADRLPKTLKYLSNQDLDKTISWEVILVNNNSKDKTVKVAERCWQLYGSPIKLSIIEESKPGLSFARAAGIAAAKYNLLVFCDDDNWLDSSYLKSAYQQFDSKPELGALGGWCDANFEKEQPEWFERFQGNFAVGKPLSKSGYLTEPTHYIFGAGMVIKKSAIEQLNKAGFKQILSDRKGTKLSSGGDVELIFALKLLDIPIYFSEKLHFTHFMPESRMKWDYLIKLRKSMQWSNFVLDIYRDAQKNTPYDSVTLLKKYWHILKKIKTLEFKNKEMDSYERLFLENKIAIQRLYLTHFCFYLRTRKSIKRFEHG